MVLSNSSHVQVVGMGQAGFAVATTLRARGFDGRISMIGEEPGHAYQRPPLSKGVLSGAVDPAALHLQTRKYYETEKIDLIEDVAISINRDDMQIHMGSGLTVPYDHLVLSTGARNRTIPGLSAPDGVFSLRTRFEAQELRARLTSATNVVVVGAGILGMEFAAAAAGPGRNVTVIDVESRSMARAASALTASRFESAHIRNGVRFAFGQKVASLVLERDGIVGVKTDTETIAADLVFIAVGVVPNTELASRSGLRVADGVIVNSSLKTSDSNISAVGDVARFPLNSHGGVLVRLENVQNAVDQGRFVAERLLGLEVEYNKVPVYWSTQLGLRLQVAGVSHATDDTVTRGDPNSDEFSVFQLRYGRVVAAESINQPAIHMASRKLIAAAVRPNFKLLADTSFDVRELLPGVAQSIG